MGYLDAFPTNLRGHPCLDMQSENSTIYTHYINYESYFLNKIL